MEIVSDCQPLISIGMPVFNCAGSVAQAISSILNQTFKEWELLIIDDGSTDNTVDIAAAFDDPRIILIEGGANKRLPARLNECIDLAKGRFFARMDGDDIAYPGRLQCQLDFLLSHPDVDLVGGWVVVFRFDGTAFGARRGPLTHEQICAYPWRGIPMAHPTWMGKTQWFLRHRYRTDAQWMEDQELLLRTYQKSRFATVPQIVLGYREDSLSLGRLLCTRRNMCSMMVRIAREQNRFAIAALGIAGQVARSLVDITAIGLNLNYHLLKHRAPRASADEVAVWRDVFEETGRTVSEQIVSHEAASR
jgi:hypothetical protein